MTTSGTVVPAQRNARQEAGPEPQPDASSEPGAAARPLRLRLTPEGRRGRPGPHLDGAWWPHGRDLAVELADLVDHYPTEAGRVARALVSRPDWDDAAAPPHRVRVARGWLKVGSFPGDDTHDLLLTLLGGRLVRLLVVPPSLDPDQAEEALLAASTRDNRHGAADVLRVVADGSDQVVEQWDDDGGSYWSGSTAPSHRGPTSAARPDGPGPS